MAGSIYLPILSSFNPAGINAAKTSLGGLATAFDGVKRALGVASASFVAFKAISETIDFGRSSIMAARDLERNLVGVDAIFGTLSPKMVAFTENSVAMGLSQIEAAKASTFIGSVLKQAGFSMDDVADQTQNLVGIAADLAFVYGYDVSEALSGITALFRGEYDPIEKFGVAMKQSEVNSLLAANGMDKLTGAARRQAEQTARLALFMERTADAQGQFKDSSGSLYTESVKLQKLFNNLQATVGKALVPALVKVAEALQPLVSALGPAITTLFTEFAGIIGVLAGQLSNAQSSLNDVIKVFGMLFGIIKAVLPFIIENAAAIITFIAVTKGIIVLTPIVQGLRVQFALLKLELAAGATMAKLFGVAMATSMGPLGIAAAAVGLFAALLITSKNNLDKETKSLKENVYYRQKFNEAAKDSITWASVAAKLGGTTPTEIMASNYGKGAGGAIIGKADQNALTELEQTMQDWLKKFTGAATEATKATGKATKDTKDVIEAQKQALVELKKEFLSLGQAVKPLAQVTRDIGEFEKNTIDSFDAIIKKLQDSVADGKISAAASNSIQAYVATERTALEALGRQRDEILKKRGLAETLVADIKAAIIGVGGLAGLLESETRQITVATTKIVDGFTITTKRTVDEIVGGKGVLSKLTAVVAKTKAFAAQLTQLKKLGLNENLFKQIVEAGPDVGGQLATEILSGGADSVSALNTTFKELEDVASAVAEQTAVVMYNSGVEVAGGLVNGLLSQEAQLVAAANKLADAFNAAYQLKIKSLEIPTGGGPAVSSEALRLGDIKLAGEKAGASAQAQANAALAAKLINTPQFTAFGNQSYINVTVNAGAGTNGKAVGQQIQSLLNQYAKSSK